MTSLQSQPIKLIERVAKQRVSWVVLVLWLFVCNVLVIILTISYGRDASFLSLPPPPPWQQQQLVPHLLPTLPDVQSLLQQHAQNENVDDYFLARTQSFGFLDDITNAEWLEFYLRPARRYQPYRFPDNPNLYSEKVPFWIFHNWDPYFACPRLRRMGGKKVCDPDRIAQQRTTEAPCLIYAFAHGDNGTTNQWVNAAAGYFQKSCEFHIFDASDSIRQGSDNVIHHHWTPADRTEHGATMSLMETKEQLGHGDRTIDILSLDCNGCEWSIFRQVIDVSPAQVLVQTHDLPLLHQTKDTTKFGKLPPVAANEFFDEFRKSNFVLFGKEVMSETDECLETNWSLLRLHHSFLGHANQSLIAG